MSFTRRLANLARGLWRTHTADGEELRRREAALDRELEERPARPREADPERPPPAVADPPDEPAPKPPERNPDGSVKRTL